ncbi:trypsin epsilon-like [Daktulosphaira vitifoliae]|uniref:trypsin epsilon-like n=1 Tax=Daktulosphaira vitifoliae TaxID=58002 RepID=UPI0021AA2C64|nr:trypsin epsilon-like [Daktulosphaira vitifoliae]
MIHNRMQLKRREVKATNFIGYGKNYDTDLFPYVVMILIKPKGSEEPWSCTGSLLKPTFVLTAAHCSNKVTAECLSITVGYYYGKESKKVTKIHQHTGYRAGEDPKDDICVLELESPFSNVDTFVEIGGNPEEFKNGATVKCTAIGFGSTENDGEEDEHGRQIDTQVKHGPTACKYKESGWEFLLCGVMDKKQTCLGDSGGPLICNRKIYGIAKDGYNTVDTQNPMKCGDPQVQFRHTFLYKYKDWVFNIIDPNGSIGDSKNEEEDSDGDSENEDGAGDDGGDGGDDNDGGDGGDDNDGGDGDDDSDGEDDKKDNYIGDNNEGEELDEEENNDNYSGSSTVNRRYFIFKLLMSAIVYIKNL